ncbi:MAG: pantoate--beta-alanine ligase [bacterium]
MNVMEYIKECSALSEKSRHLVKQGYRIGLVPTMGFFHEGHLSLMDRARKECDIVIVTLFINPIQFGPNEDLALYPRDIERDRDLAEKRGVDILFHPGSEQIYPEGFRTNVIVNDLSTKLCGISRPTHFRGVTTVVCKLFNLTCPTIAYFGQKDAQQAIIIKQMVRDLNFQIKIEIMPIVREADGLAMSSRNSYLNPEERLAAVCLYTSLIEAESLIKKGEKKSSNIIRKIKEVINNEPLAILEYGEVVDTVTLSPLEIIDQESLIALAVKIGKTRLIDNIIISPCKKKGDDCHA